MSQSDCTNIEDQDPELDLHLCSEEDLGKELFDQIKRDDKKGENYLKELHKDASDAKLTVPQYLTRFITQDLCRSVVIIQVGTQLCISVYPRRGRAAVAYDADRKAIEAKHANIASFKVSKHFDSIRLPFLSDLVQALLKASGAVTLTSVSDPTVLNKLIPSKHWHPLSRITKADGSQVIDLKLHSNWGRVSSPDDVKSFELF